MRVRKKSPIGSKAQRVWVKGRRGLGIKNKILQSVDPQMIVASPNLHDGLVGSLARFPVLRECPRLTDAETMLPEDGRRQPYLEPPAKQPSIRNVYIPVQEFVQNILVCLIYSYGFKRF
jgi:hypothetical protein